MRDILKVAWLIRVLEDVHESKDTKIQCIKNARDAGHITPEEAVELALEYT